MRSSSAALLNSSAIVAVFFILSSTHHRIPVVDACNYVKFNAGDGTAIAGRDMQFTKPSDEFETLVRTHPKGEIFHPPSLDIQPYAQPGGLAHWKVKYGYVALDMYDWIAGVRTIYIYIYTTLFNVVCVIIYFMLPR